MQLLPASSEEQPGRLEERQAGREPGRREPGMEGGNQTGREVARKSSCLPGCSSTLAGCNCNYISELSKCRQVRSFKAQCKEGARQAGSRETFRLPGIWPRSIVHAGSEPANLDLI